MAEQLQLRADVKAVDVRTRLLIEARATPQLVAPRPPTRVISWLELVHDVLPDERVRALKALLVVPVGDRNYKGLPRRVR